MVKEERNKFFKDFHRVYSITRHLTTGPVPEQAKGGCYLEEIDAIVARMPLLHLFPPCGKHSHV